MLSISQFIATLLGIRFIALMEFKHDSVIRNTPCIPSNDLFSLVRLTCICEDDLHTGQARKDHPLHSH